MDKMRNMIRIKDVPSNTIEEAIIILKENKKAKKYEGSNKFKNIDSIDCDNKYVVKEAELIISEYLEKNDDSKKDVNKKKIKKLRIINTVLLLSLIVSIIL